MIRGLVANTSGWLSGRKVLLDSHAVRLIDRDLHTVWVSLPCGRIDIAAVDTSSRSVRAMLDCTLIAVDGHIGGITDVFFDDEIWALRYLVVQMDSWLLGRRVLVNTDRVRRVDWVSESVEVNQTRNQIEQGWECDMESPPPRDLEAALRTRAGTQARRQ
jgi:hypothetical protein